ncbi:MAG: fimbria/pilus periplasmic chaperone [Terracidiphilus sp.]|jgi:fimbrial chaperone protein
MPACKAFAVVAIVLLTGLTAGAQTLSVLPVNIFLPPGQKATTLTVTNPGKSETSIQIRAYSWNQSGDDDPLTATTAVGVSPPMATIAPGASQVVRIILRQSPQDREATYRILVDQIPPPAEPGFVRVVLRLSIPIFAQPMVRTAANVQFHLEINAGKIILVGVNDGLRHDAIRDIALTTGDGRTLKLDGGFSPYVLAGATRHWPLAVQGPLPLPGEVLKMTARADAGAIEEQVHVAAAP